MYDITQQLLSKDKVDIFMSKKQAIESGIDEMLGRGYEDDNDYEKYSIIHRDYCNIGSKFNVIFVRGKNFYKYVDRIYPRKTYTCMFCGNNNVRYANIDYDFHGSYAPKELGAVKDQIINEICDTQKYHYENTSVTYVERPLTSNELKDFLRCVVNAESNIDFLERRIQTLTKEYVDYCYELLPQLLSYNMPKAIDLLKKLPPEPTYKTPSIFNKKAVDAENEALKKAYLASSDYLEAAESQKQYLAIREEYFKKSKSIYKGFRHHIVSLTLDKYINSNSNLIKKITLLGSEIGKCHQQVHECILELKKLYLTPYLYEKYQNLPAAATMLEYLESGRCTTLEGSAGAYNLYEEEERANVIVTRLDVIIASLDQIRDNQYVLYNVISSVDRSLKQMNANTQNILNKLDQLEYNSSLTEYNTRQMAYYSKITADSTATSAFLDLLQK